MHSTLTVTLGPSFSHPSLPLRSHFIGSSSPRSSPSYYLEAIQDLIQTYGQISYGGVPDEEDDPGDTRNPDVIPLVVNTMGWTKGLGASLLQRIQDQVEPTHIFDFGSSINEDRMELAYDNSGVDPTTGSCTIQIVDPIPPSLVSSRYSPADLRTLSILSYFHATFPCSHPSTDHTTTTLTSVYATSWTVDLPLCAYPPYQLTIPSALDAIVLTGAGSEDIVPSEVHRVLNCAIVALLAVEPDSYTLPSPESASSSSTSTTITSPMPYSQGAPPPSPSASSCIGLGIVRAVQETAQSLELLTPIPPSLLASTQPRVMLKGELELPIWAFLDFRVEGRGVLENVEVPFLQWGKGEGLGEKRRRTRRNLMRKGQM